MTLNIAKSVSLQYGATSIALIDGGVIAAMKNGRMG